MPNRPVGRDELSRRLHDLRQASGLSGEAAAERVGSNQSKISRVETGRTVPEPEFVDALCRAYRAGAAERRELVAMAEDVKAANRRVVLRREVAGFQAQLGRIQHQSALARCFSPVAIYGLLQTAEYVRAVFSSGKDLSADAVEAGIQARLANQDILDDEHNPRQFVVTMPEGAFGWALLPPNGMAAQMEHLVDASRRPNVEVGIIPWGGRATVLPSHTWSLYDQRAVIVGTTTATAILTEPVDVARYVELTDELERLAVFGDEARAILDRVAERYRRLASS